MVRTLRPPVSRRSRARGDRRPGTPVRARPLPSLALVSVDLEDADQFIAIGRVDWLVAKSWRYLHAVPDDAWTADHRADIAMCWQVEIPIRLACGRVAAMLMIPGMFSRGGFGGGLPRCSGCCRALGYPEGTGSPKNDPRCREILGLN